MDQNMAANLRHEAFGDIRQGILAVMNNCNALEQKCSEAIESTGKPSRQTLFDRIRAEGDVVVLMLLGVLPYMDTDEERKAMGVRVLAFGDAGMEREQRALAAWDAQAAGEAVPEEFKRFFRQEVRISEFE
jgi:hypothetical protein